MEKIQHLFHIDASTAKVFEAISTVKGLQCWWTHQTEGDAQPGGVLIFRFGEYGGMDFQVESVEPDQKLSWVCVDGPTDWIGTRVDFYLDTNENKTRVKFSHSLWREQNDFMAQCNFSWGRYLSSLRDYCETGTGKPFGI